MFPKFCSGISCHRRGWLCDKDRPGISASREYSIWTTRKDISAWWLGHLPHGPCRNLLLFALSTSSLKLLTYSYELMCATSGKWYVLTPHRNYKPIIKISNEVKVNGTVSLKLESFFSFIVPQLIILLLYNRIISCEAIKLNKVFSVPFGKLSILPSHFNSLKTSVINNVQKSPNWQRF